MPYETMTAEELAAEEAKLAAEKERREQIATIQGKLDQAVADLTAASREMEPLTGQLVNNIMAEALPSDFIDWVAVTDPNARDAKPWVQPQRPSETYQRGDAVTYLGRIYVSRVNNNSDSPTAYPQGWELLRSEAK